MHKKTSIRHLLGAGILLMSSQTVLADISGKVFRDFNANGAFDTGASFNEVGMAGVTVKAFDATGAETSTATSASDGTYALAGLSNGADYRVEFSWAQRWLKPGAAGGTSVQFVKDGRSGLNFGVNSPENFSQDNPQVAVANFSVGEPTAPQVASQPRIIEFGYTSGADGRTFAISGDANVMLQREVTDIAISSPVSSAGTFNAIPPDTGHSRIDSVAMGGSGPLYGLAYHRTSNTLLAGSFMKRFVGFPGGASDTKLGTIYAIDRKVSPNTITPFFTANAGVDSHDYSTSSMDVPSGDKTAASNVGKAGWADIDLSPDGKTLYAINLFDKKLYVIPIETGASGISAGVHSTVDFPASATTDVCANGDWVPGGIKIAQDSVFVSVTCTAETSQSVNDLHYYIYAFPQDNPSHFSTIADIPNYTRSTQWHPWINNPYDFSHQFNQPWLMDIEFDDVGRLYVGVRNRTADMTSANDGAFFFEFGDTIAGLPSGDGTYNMLTDDFVDDDSGHDENDMGTLAIWSGSGTMMTPAHVGNLVQGIRTYNTNAASTVTAKGSITPLRYFGINQTPRATSVLGDPFGKTAGLGDIEVLAQPSPVEVGNRVWADTNSNGIQDAGEAGIDGVQVKLVCGADEATATTANGGVFTFSNATGGNATFMGYGESCTLKVDNTQAIVNNYSLTTQNADGVTDNNAQTDLRDSDAIDKSGIAEIAFTVGNAGENNHTLDIGYKSAPVADLSLTKVLDKTEAKRGDTVVYTLTVSNAGANATGAAVTDPLPAGVTWLSDDGAGAYDKATGVWTVGELLKDASKTLHITVTID